MRLTESQMAALEEVRDFTASGDFAWMFTGRSFRRSTALALKGMGLLDSRPMDVADADGWTRHTCRPREGYFLTPEGHDALAREEGGK